MPPAGRWNRPELHRLLDQLRKGDVLVVWKRDRLSHSLRDVLTIMERLGEGKAGSSPDRGDRHHDAGGQDDDADGRGVRLNSKARFCGNERRRAWIPPVGKAASG